MLDLSRVDCKREDGTGYKIPDDPERGPFKTDHIHGTNRLETMTDDKKERILAYSSSGMSLKRIADLEGISKTTTHCIVKRGRKEKRGRAKLTAEEERTVIQLLDRHEGITVPQLCQKATEAGLPLVSKMTMGRTLKKYGKATKRQHTRLSADGVTIGFINLPVNRGNRHFCYFAPPFFILLCSSLFQ